MDKTKNFEQQEILAEGSQVRAPTGQPVILKEQVGESWLASDGGTYPADQLKPLTFSDSIAGAPPGTTRGDGPAGLIGAPS